MTALVLFHDQCADGLAAAWTAWRVLGSGAEYMPVRYDEPPPKQVGDRDIYVLDFSYDPKTLAGMADAARRLVVIDHHATAIDQLKGWKARPDVELVLDKTHSGAQLALRYFSVPDTRLWIIDYVEDRDLWRFGLPHSKEINALIAASALGRTPLDAFQVFEELRGYSMKKAVERGAGALLQIECYARQVAKEARRITFSGYPEIPVVNLPKPMTSEVLHALTSEAPFAVGWRQEGAKAVFSLRSSGNPGFNVATLAERYGGGGHHNAAGFTLDFAAVETFVLGKTP